jgi:hypothetical protein
MRNLTLVLFFTILVLGCAPTSAPAQQICVDLTAKEIARALEAKALVEAENGVSYTNKVFTKAMLRKGVIFILRREHHRVAEEASESNDAALDQAIESDFPSVTP